MGLRCKRCGSEEHVRNGLMRGKQRYRCKACGLNFTDTPPRGMPLAVKVTAVLLYVSGLSMNRTAKLLGGHRQLDDAGRGKLTEQDGVCRQAATSPPVTSAQTASAVARAARYSVAVR